MKSAVIGGGSWGTALASVLSDLGPVKLWARDPEIAERITQTGRNPKYLTEFELAPHLTGTTLFEAALSDVDLVCIVVPSHAMRSVMSRAAAFIPPNALIVSASKGIENESLMTMEEVLLEVLPPANSHQVGFLSGPSFARETIARMATAVTIASRSPEVAKALQDTFSRRYFRAYTTDDVVGVELGGALKNVVAIAAGCIDGLGLGHNTMAALLTRGLAEITRLAVARGAHPLTLSGLAGMGDLVLTCTGSLSRNRTVGYHLGQGHRLDDILKTMNQVAEGVRTTKSAYHLARNVGVEMPIVTEVFRILYEGKPCKNALADLMGRAPKEERS
ncbi:MAG: NAD(P)H-dependent glycerol-3-phosphate dehydrogenase [Myxococcota bacterium]|nr:NAD(P)H-dependent glycerol-3-phosphate dehydrogenase [Myxococcota bacterium]